MMFTIVCLLLRGLIWGAAVLPACHYLGVEFSWRVGSVVVIASIADAFADGFIVELRKARK
jgi:hypothetical protein